jgi:hypothetical protein
MFGRRGPSLTEIMRRIFSSVGNTRRIIADWLRDEKQRSAEPVVGRHVLGGQ